MNVARTAIRRGDIIGTFRVAGIAKAASILAAVEFTRRRVKPAGIKSNQPSDIVPHIRHYADWKQEHFICASVNGANEIVNMPRGLILSMTHIKTHQSAKLLAFPPISCKHNAAF